MPLYMSERWVLFTGDSPDEVRELLKLGLGLCFGRDGCYCCCYCCCCCCCCYCFFFVVEANFVNRRVWPLYRNGSHKKVEKLSNEKVSEVCQMGGYRKLGYLNDEWWVISDENWVRSNAWWKKKNPNRDLASILALYSFYSSSSSKVPHRK